MIAPLLPPEPPKPKGGRPHIPARAALTDILFVLKTGLQKLASPEFRQHWEANQRAAKLRRGRPHADALRALPPEVFAVLEEP